MTRTLTLLIPSLLAALCAASSAQQPRATDLVQPQLLADTSAIEPGKPFRLAILLRISPSWHVYWKNPGDAGQPVTVSFTLPPGYTISPLQYPVPSKFLQPGDLLAYGYESELLLVTTVTPPPRESRAVPGPIPLQAKLKYLVCDPQTCLPGQADLSLSLPLSNSPTPANQDLFSRWLPQIPLAGPSASSVADVQSTGSLTGQSGDYTLDITWKQPADNIEFFPGPSSSLSLHDIVVKNKNNHSRVTFTADLLAGQKPNAPSLDSVVVYTDPQGVRRGIDVSIPLNAQQK